jgi:sulfur transfer complex TusBCD TusB component (DsrH family)
MRSHSVGKNLVANTKTTLFTVPTRNIALWRLLYAFNNTSSAKTFSCWWYDKSEDVEVAIASAYPLSSKTFFLLGDGNYVALDEGDEIRAISEIGATTTIVITVDLDARSAVQNFA